MQCNRCTRLAEPDRKLCSTCRENQARRSAKWYRSNQVDITARKRGRRDEDRAEVMRRLGERCACCGEMTPAFLTIDHPNNDGAEHRRKGIQGGLIQWHKILATWGQYELRILCWNCHRAVSMRGACPHKVKSELR